MAREVHSADKFEVSRVFTRAFGAIGRNFLVFGAIAVLLYAVPYFAWQGLYAYNLVTPVASEADIGALASYTGMSILSMMVSVVLQALLLAAITRGMAQSRSGGRASLGACLTTALTSFLPVTALALMCFISILAGSLLLLAPGLILWTIWAVVIPAFVEDRLGLLESFGRSMELTRGARWPVFGALVAVTVASWIAGIVVGFVLALSTISLQLPYLFLGLVAVISALLAMVGAAVTASIYLELREAKEDAPPAELETIFA